MCTVSFYRDRSRTVITSNRDEHIDRPLALPPRKTIYKSKMLYFPVDPLAGGTWFAVDTHANVFVLLNGADTKHTPQPPYRCSRGIILLELSSAPDPEQAWLTIDLDKIEPFTLITYCNRQLVQYRWNGRLKTRLDLDSHTHHIWSSATLYTEAVINNRKRWFDQFMHEQLDLTASALFQFHTATQSEDTENGLIINRNQTLLTKNVTQCIIEPGQFTLKHVDLISQKNAQIISPLP